MPTRSSASAARSRRELREERVGGQPVLDFRVGVADSVAKPVASRLLAPALQLPQPVRLICIEGKHDDLLAQLALHRLDLVLADEPLSRRLSVKAFNHPLGSSPMSFFAAPSLLPGLQGAFPKCLNGAPMLIQGASSPVRQQLESWLQRHHLQPRVVGEFDDGALMKAFGRDGHGVFMSPSVLEAETVGAVRRAGHRPQRRAVGGLLRHLGGAAHHPPRRGGDHECRAQRPVRP